MKIISFSYVDLLERVQCILQVCQKFKNVFTADGDYWLPSIASISFESYYNSLMTLEWKDLLKMF